MERKHINWQANDQLLLLKTLAWTVWKYESTNEVTIWRRVGELCAPAMEKLTGETGVTLQGICEETLAVQGATITPRKLQQRADKLARYLEVGQLLMDRVEAVYRELTKRAA